MQQINTGIDALERLITRRAGIMNGFFLLVYSLEQALLVILTAMYPLHIMFIISLFVITAFATFGIEKVILENKNRHLEEELYKLRYERITLIETAANYKAMAKRAMEKTSKRGMEKLKKDRLFNYKKVKVND